LNNSIFLGARLRGPCTVLVQGGHDEL